MVVVTRCQTRFYGKGVPGLANAQWPGHLVVVEGGDCAGCSTQTDLLAHWLQTLRKAVLTTSLEQSRLAGELIIEAQREERLKGSAFILLYATALADELERRIIPALRDGYTVLADRYLFSLMAWNLARGHRESWLKEVLSFALVPDLILYLQTSPIDRIQRALIRRDRFSAYGRRPSQCKEDFQKFADRQQLHQEKYEELAEQYPFTRLDGSASMEAVHREAQGHVERLLTGGELLGELRAPFS